ncbi:hypothetical protein ASF71_19275 [Deinococcus sp. Leaf326]|nr:hypothetical protein ASF71_19275 [Deinococcus sp. Leaf326]
MPRVAQLLTGPDRLRFAQAMHRSGITSPDLKVAVLRCIPAHSRGAVPHDLTFSWLVALHGEQATAQSIMEHLLLHETVTVAPPLVPGLCFARSVRAIPAAVPMNAWGRGEALTALKGVDRLGGLFSLGQFRLRNAVFYLQDSARLLLAIRQERPDFAPLLRGLWALHDDLGQIRRALWRVKARRARPEDVHLAQTLTVLPLTAADLEEDDDLPF